MPRALFIFRILLVLATAIFVAFHTQIFISKIEPNFIFSWLAAFLIEGFLISLAVTQTAIARLLLIPLFLISVISASASFVVKNEQLLNDFFQDRRLAEQLKADIADEAKNQVSLSAKYTTKTLVRERVLKDELLQILKGRNGDIALINALIFLILVLVMQAVSLYTAMTFKRPHFRENEVKIRVSSEKVSGQVPAEIEGDKKEKSPEEPDRNFIIAELRKRKNEGRKLEELAAIFNVPKTTISKILQWPQHTISDEVFRKISEKL